MSGASIGARRTAAIEFQSLSSTSTDSFSAASNALENLSGMIRNPNTPAGGSSGRMNDKPSSASLIAFYRPAAPRAIEKRGELSEQLVDIGSGTDDSQAGPPIILPWRAVR
jgi:hypothetical protein